LAALLPCAFPTLAAEENAPVPAKGGSPFTFFANRKGTCRYAELDGKDVTSSCKPGLVNIGYKNSRLLYMFFVEGPVVFSGEGLQPPDVSTTSLAVSVLSFGPDDRRTASGHCFVDGDPAGQATFVCEATLAGRERMAARFVFTSSGAPEVQTDDGPVIAQGRASASDSLAARLAREASVTAAFPIKTADGVIHAEVLAAAPPTLDDDPQPLIQIPIGTQTPISCLLLRKRIDGVTALYNRTRPSGPAVQIHEQHLASPTMVAGGRLVVFASSFYSTPGRPGLLKLAVLQHPNHSLVCEHDEVGYADTFERVVTSLAASLRSGTPDPRAAARFLEFRVRLERRQQRTVPVGWVERTVLDLPEGGREVQEMRDYYEATATGFSARVSSIIEVMDKNGRVIHKRVLEALDGKVTIDSQASDVGASELVVPKEAMRLAADGKGELRLPNGLVYTPDPEHKGGLCCAAAAFRFCGTADANGMWKTWDAERDGTRIHEERVWARGAPVGE
jgi:hypothetical protein